MLKQLLQRLFPPSKPLEQWFTITFDETQVTLNAEPPGREAWTQSFEWRHISKICFKGEGLSASDGIYVFTTQRPESYVVPTEGKGGAEFWNEVLRRGLFDPELAIKAASTPEGTFCWPKE